jgi:predicted tellurium resistance membrane protein TerC
MLELLTDPHAWAALATLTVLEIVLGIDNIVFISVLVSRCNPKEAERARKIGLSLALVFRIALLFTLTALIALREPLFTIFGTGISWRDIILIGGGLFLMAKATHEIHGEIEPHDAAGKAVRTQAFYLIVIQLVAVDLVFSVDSIITAIGLAEDIEVMVAAVIIAMIVMYFASAPVSKFVSKHPTTKMLALAFLLLIGMALVADGFDVHIPRGYIYFAMAFAGAVEMFNVIAAGRRKRAAR